MKTYFNIVLVSFMAAAASCTPGRQLRQHPALGATVVFEPHGDYAAMRIPALVRTQAGTLLAFCEGRIGNASDTTDMDLLLRRSVDGGNTWQPIQVIAPRQQGATSNPTPILDKEGRIHLLYQRRYERAYYIRSTDEGKTWSPPVDMTATFASFRPEYDWQVLAPGPGHAIQLNNGRLLVPVWMRTPKAIIPQRTYRVGAIYSDDAGATWKRGGMVPEDTIIRQPNESMVTQLADGRVLMTIRNNSAIRRRGVSYSSDGGLSWSQPVADTALFEPRCMASMTGIADKATGRQRLLFLNPDSRAIPKHPRKQLTARISYDAGATWPVKKLIDTAAAGYSDVAVDAAGKVFCVYETNTVGKGWNYSIVMKRFPVSWVEAGNAGYGRKSRN